MMKEETLKPKLKEIGLTHGAALKVTMFLSGAVYEPQPIGKVEPSNQIKEILNEPMEDNFEPKKDQLNLNEQFKDSNGNISIRRSLEKLAKGEIIPNGVSSENPIFYLKSTNHNRYFKITMVYKDE